MSNHQTLRPVYYRSQWAAKDIPSTLQELEASAGNFGIIAVKRAEWAAAIIWADTQAKPYSFRGPLSKLLSDTHRYVEEASIRAGFLPGAGRLDRDGNGASRRQRALRLFGHWEAAGRPFLVEGINVAFADIAYRAQMTGAVHGLLSQNRRVSARARRTQH